MSRVRLPLALWTSVVALLFAACSGGDEATPFPTATIPPSGGATSVASATAEGSPATTATATGTLEATGTAEASQTPTVVATATAAPSTPQPVAFTKALGGRVFDRPVEFVAYPGGRFLVADQGGQIFLLNADGSAESVLVDLRNRVSREGNEEGLLSVALDPGFGSNGYLWTHYSAAGPRRSVLSRFTVASGVADPGSQLVVLEIAEPFSNHNGGSVRFGPDGMLYLGIGDGGGAGDSLGSGQDRSTLLGSIIRIDVRKASSATPYAVPADNPFVGEAGLRPEIWSYGVRNPWRMAWDRGTLWVGDVGQNAIEEISIASRGANLGWNRLEGTQCYQSGCSADGTTLPVATYSHAGGRCSVTGGVVYRGTVVPEIAGSYLYSDFCSGELWALPADGSSAPVIVASGLGNVASIGVYAAGEVYVLRFGQSIVRLVSP